MKTALLIFFSLLFVPQGAGGHYAKDGLAFDYPAGWTLAESGDAQTQRLTLRREGASNIILVFVQREPVTTVEQLYASRNNVTIPYVFNIATKLGLSRPPPVSEMQCVQAGGRPAAGFRMGGLLEGAPTTAEVYTVVLNQRLLHLVNVRADKDEAAGAEAWKSLLDTLRVDAPAKPSPEAEMLSEVVAGGMLNGKALKKPNPRYPVEARSSRVQGTVAVQIIVDEQGNVVSAKAVSGPRPLHGASEEAARKAKFEPMTLCGRPAKVSGVITYGFTLG
ncbi:MAG TPA: energy transducer TonB [Pyrinomonadaceae bacterium]